jgi:hypothetical protein
MVPDGISFPTRNVTFGRNLLAGKQGPIAYALDDGGWVEIEDAELMPLGNKHAHRCIVYRHDGDADRPAARITFELVGGVPVCTSFGMWSPEGSQTPIRERDLSASKLNRLRDAAFAATGVFTPNPHGGWMRPIGPRSAARDRAQVKRAATPPYKLTREFLEKVAEIHNATPPGGRLEAVSAAFPPTRHPRTVLRWVAAARKAGLIDD